MKCHICKEELQHIDSWSLSCPNTHGHVNLEDGKITAYRFYVWEDKVRYTIEQAKFVSSGPGNPPIQRVYFSKHTKIPNLVKSKKGKTYQKGHIRKRQQLLTLHDRFLPVTLDQDGVLEVDKLLHKLKTYVLFS